MPHMIEYKDWMITHNAYGRGEYTVVVDGDDVWFDTLDGAKKFIDSMEVV